MAKKTLLTKSAKGINPGDVANPGVRNILCEISKQLFSKIDDQYLIEAAQFFNYKCPYTGRDISAEINNFDKTNLVVDHIVGHNKSSLGLNVKGNVIIVDRNANKAKGAKTVEEFIMNNTKVLGNISVTERQERIKKIHEFQELYSYDKSAIENIIQTEIQKYYDQIILLQKTFADNLIKKIKYDQAIVLQSFANFLNDEGMSKKTIIIYTNCIKKLLNNKFTSINDLLNTKSLDALIKSINNKSSTTYIKDSGNTSAALGKFKLFKDTI